MRKTTLVQGLATELQEGKGNEPPKVTVRGLEAPKTEKENLQGTWRGVTFEYLRSPNARGVPPGFGGDKQRAEITKARWVITPEKILVYFKRVPGGLFPEQEKTAIPAQDEVRQMDYRLNLDDRRSWIDLTPCAFPYNPPPAGIVPPPGFLSLNGTSQGIFERKGDTLRICYGVPKMKRPLKFEAEGDNTYFQFVLKRESELNPKTGTDEKRK